MARVTSAISCFRSFSTSSSFGACAFISISPFAALLKRRGLACSIQGQSEHSLKTLRREQDHRLARGQGLLRLEEQTARPTRQPGQAGHSLRVRDSEEVYGRLELPAIAEIPKRIPLCRG